MQKILSVSYRNKPHYWINTTHTQMCVRAILVDKANGQVTEVTNLSEIFVDDESLKDLHRAWCK